MGFLSKVVSGANGAMVKWCNRKNLSVNIAPLCLIAQSGLSFYVLFTWKWCKKKDVCTTSPVHHLHQYVPRQEVSYGRYE